MVCPKCGTAIKRFDLSPNCKVCGVHILYYTQEEDLARDAKRTELEFAFARSIFAKLKGNFIAGKLPILRIVFCVLSIASLCLPTIGVHVAVPLSEIEISTGIIGVYRMYSSSAYKLLPALFKLKPGGTLTTLVAADIALFVLSVLAALLSFALLLISFVNIKKFAKVLSGIAFAGCTAGVAATVCSAAAGVAAADCGYIVVSTGFGAVVSAVMFAVLGVLNVLMAKNGEPITLSDADIKRIELYKLFKAKKLDLDTLPLPIYETAEEREKRENAIAGVKKNKKEASGNG